jgi:hypothetical protein
MSGAVGQLAVIFRAGIFMVSILEKLTATIETGLREFIEMLLENMRVVALGYQR